MVGMSCMGTYIVPKYVSTMIGLLEQLGLHELLVLPEAVLLTWAFLPARGS